MSAEILFVAYGSLDLPSSTRHEVLLTVEEAKKRCEFSTEGGLCNATIRKGMPCNIMGNGRCGIGSPLIVDPIPESPSD